MTGNELKHLRSVANLSQQDLATKIGVYQPYIANMEGGSASITGKNKVAILKALADEGIGKTEIELLSIIQQAKGRGK